MSKTLNAGWHSLLVIECTDINTPQNMNMNVYKYTYVLYTYTFVCIEVYTVLSINMHGLTQKFNYLFDRNNTNIIHINRGFDMQFY